MLCCLHVFQSHPTTTTNGLVAGNCLVSDIRNHFLERLVLSEYMLPRSPAVPLAFDISVSVGELFEPVQVVLYIGSKRLCLDTLRPGKLELTTTKIISDLNGQLLRLLIFDQAGETIDESAIVFKDLKWTIVQRPVTLLEKLKVV